MKKIPVLKLWVAMGFNREMAFTSFSFILLYFILILLSKSGLYYTFYGYKYIRIFFKKKI